MCLWNPINIPATRRGTTPWPQHAAARTQTGLTLPLPASFGTWPLLYVPGCTHSDGQGNKKTDDVQGIHHGTALRCLWSQVLFGFRSLEWLGPPCYIWQDRWSWTRSWQSRRWNEDPRTDVVSSWVVAPSWGVVFNKRRYSKEKSTLHMYIYILHI